MAKVKITLTDDLEYPYLIEYTCLCGSPVKLYTHARPKKLATCFDCAMPVEQITSNKYDARTNTGYVSHNKQKSKQKR